MNSYNPTPRNVGQRVTSAICILFFGAIALSLAVEMIKAILPWLIGLGVFGSAVALTVWRLKERNSRW
jgi:hypothetical protein